MAELKLTRISDIKSEPVDWLWEPYIPSGAISLLQGDGGLGKTTLSLVIAAAITKGEPLPGQFVSTPTPPANVIIQNGEDSFTRTIKPRLEQLGADCSRIFTIDEKEMPLSFADARIEEAIVQTEAKLIILDPVQAFFGRANMNAANSVRPVMKQLGAVAEWTDCAVLLVGHLGKTNRRAQYRGLGSVDIFAVSRSVLTVGNTNIGNDIRAMVHNKSNLAPAGVSLTYAIDPIHGFSWMGEHDISIDELLSGRHQPKQENQFSKATVFIENTLRNGPMLAVDIMQLAEEQGISEKTLQRAKSALGVYSSKRNGRWYWELPIEGEYSEVYEGGQYQHDQHDHYAEDSQDCHEDTQDGHCTNLTILTPLTILPESEPNMPPNNRGGMERQVV